MKKAAVKDLKEGDIINFPYIEWEKGGYSIHNGKSKVKANTTSGKVLDLVPQTKGMMLVVRTCLIGNEVIGFSSNPDNEVSYADVVGIQPVFFLKLGNKVSAQYLSGNGIAWNVLADYNKDDRPDGIREITGEVTGIIEEYGDTFIFIEGELAIIAKMGNKINILS